MINTIELFAGVGGFRIGLEREGGFQVVWGNQWEPTRKKQDAFDCYSRNFSGNGIHSNQDIATVDAKQFIDKDIQLIVGGFPCQDYSVARSLSNEKGIEGKKGVLFWEIIRFVRAIKPKYLLLENVDRLLKAPSKQRGRDFSIMLASLRDEGFTVEWRVINAADYGFPQRRRRVFIFASLNNSSYVKNRISVPPKRLINNKGFFATKFPLESKNSKKEPQQFTLPKDIVSISDSFSATYFNAGVMINGVIYTEEVIPKTEKSVNLGDILEDNVDEEYYLSNEKLEKFKYLKGAKRIPRVSKSGHGYIYSEGAVAFPDYLDRPARTMLTSEGSVNRSTHVVEDPQTKRLRILTPVECERLNGFPDNWTKGMSDRMRYFCMGNALVVGLIERMAKRITEINNEDVKKIDSN